MTATHVDTAWNGEIVPEEPMAQTYPEPYVEPLPKMVRALAWMGAALFCAGCWGLGLLWLFG